MSEEPMEIVSAEIPAKHFSSASDRDKAIIDRYKEGLRLKDIAIEFNLSEVRISQIVKANHNLIAVDREVEKVRRLRRLKLCEAKAPKLLAPKDATELVRVIEAQRKELEGDGDVVNNNTQINIRGDVNILKASEKWTALRSMLEGE